MILSDPYQFKPLELQQDPRLLEFINRYIITDYAYSREKQPLKVRDFQTPHGVLRPVLLYGGSTAEKDIPAFHHPLINHKNNWIAYDLRSLVRPPVQGEPIQARNTSDYALACTRFVLTGLWLEERQPAMYALKLPHVSFAEWISVNLARKFGLPITDQIKLFVLSAVYYRHQFTNSFDADDVTKLKVKLRGEVFVESIIDEVISCAPDLSSAEAFCNACHQVTGNPRLQGMSLGVLLNVLQNNWFGTNGQELVALSLVHPPTWISLVDASVTSKTFRNNFVTKVVESKNKKGASAEFIKELAPLVRSKIGE